MNPNEITPQDIGAIVDKAVRDKLATIKLTVQEGN